MCLRVQSVGLLSYFRLIGYRLRGWRGRLLRGMHGPFICRFCGSSLLGGDGRRVNRFGGGEQGEDWTGCLE